jgi:hypothetical protein
VPAPVIFLTNVTCLDKLRVVYLLQIRRNRRRNRGEILDSKHSPQRGQRFSAVGHHHRHRRVLPLVLRQGEEKHCREEVRLRLEAPERGSGRARGHPAELPADAIA